MSGLVAVRPLFRTRLRALGLTEWTDAFATDNIPSTILNNSFHLDTSAGSRRGAYDQNHQECEQELTVRVFLKGYRYPADAVDDALEWLDDILEDVLDPAVRAGAAIKNIYANNWEINPLAESNDNAVVLEIRFSCLIIV